MGRGKVLVQSPPLGLQSTWLAAPPTWPWLCLALPLQEVISGHCLAHQVTPAHPCSPSSAQAEGTILHSPRGLASVTVCLLLGLFGCCQAPSPGRRLPRGRSQACLAPVCLSALACPGCLLSMWHGECRGTPADRQPGPHAESLASQLLSWKPGWGLSGASQRGCFRMGRTFGELRARALE